MTLENLYNAFDVVQSYRWLGHKGHGYTELIAFHPEYKPCKENFEQNLKNNAFPKIWYAQSEKQIMAFLYKYHGDHMCCYGVNPRPSVLKNDNGYPKHASDTDISEVNNFYFDIDFKDGNHESKQLKTLDEFLEEVDNHLLEKGIQKPTRAFTGNGYHLLFALPYIKTSTQKDISNRLNTFYQEIYDKFISDINNIGVKFDKTTDLMRVAKIYGTRKPQKSQISRFYGSERFEDKVLLEYLLNLPIEENANINKEGKGAKKITIYKSLPKAFVNLLGNDSEIADLWDGVGKESGDISRSGYDFSLMHACIQQGITNKKSLATILAMRPQGSVKSNFKDDKYIRLTVTKALQT